MGLFDRLREGLGVQRPISPESAQASDDDQAVARYRYMLKTAPPETLEQAHAEAFARLTPEQRRKLLQQLSAEIPAAERAAAARGADDPSSLARLATRAEVREPGTLERAFGRMGGGPGLGGLLAGGFLASMAGTVLGTMMAQHFLAQHPLDAAHGASEIDAADANLEATPDIGDEASGFEGGDLGGGGDIFDI
jgi:hypothetical protein